MRAKWIPIGVAVLAIGVGLWWVIGAWTYDDLAHGSTSGVGSDAELIGDDLDGEIAEKPLRPGRTTDYTVTVRNDGGRTVEITGIGSDEPNLPGLLEQVRVRRMFNVGVPDVQYKPFAPLKLEPGEEAIYVIDLKMPTCGNLAPNSSLVLDHFDVRFKAFVFNRRQTLPLVTPIHIRRGDNC
ncbi:hypothetical protein OJ997_06680 [Solirubrobacter phytolaccae]|uniref:Uncharacterized protein n=1 Tax=Solirubrobacter phytolaccae TaxID=1404360 RepID=A0A9X3S778_9ACTN|nr:hypothetical protein [Solirubrobacter phytolaccae]MDA0179973.1 hypothetical protein [Solirubrobacter phytolaccae]